MLSELYVKNFAIIDEIRLVFDKGLTVISGETGAGKSILVEALGLQVGGKAFPSMIRTGESEAVIEAVFDVDGNRVLEEYLEESGLGDGSRVIIRRHISQEGRNRIYVNSRACSLNQLEIIGALLVDLASQNDQQVLLNEENHLVLLSKWACAADAKKSGNETTLKAAVEEYAKIYLPYKKISDEIAKQEKMFSDRESRIDFLKYQISEIEKADINEDNEEEKLLAEKSRVKNADFLNSLVSECEALLQSNENSVLDSLDHLALRVEKGLALDPDMNEGLKYLKEARVPLEEAVSFFSGHADRLHIEPGRLEEIESRLYKIFQLKKKYGASLADVRLHLKKSAEELGVLKHLENSLDEMRKEEEKLKPHVLTAAKKLSGLRKLAASGLSKAVEGELKDLSMPLVRFHVHVNSPESPSLNDCGPDGVDRVRFDLSANPGQSPRPLVCVASGGELSRIFLAIKKIIGGGTRPITYIFDEIDAGIGGAVAEVVGRKLKSISEINQVLVVTHLPQIASCAGEHYVIEKTQVKGATHTRVKVLKSSGEREAEIARMLGGLSITEKTLAHAKEMLKSGQK